MCPSGTSRLIDRGFAFCTAFILSSLECRVRAAFYAGTHTNVPDLNHKFPTYVTSKTGIHARKYFPVQHSATTCSRVFSPIKNWGTWQMPPINCGYFSGRLMQPSCLQLVGMSLLRNRPIVITSRHSEESNTIVLGDHPESDVPTSSHEENSSLSDSSE